MWKKGKSGRKAEEVRCREKKKEEKKEKARKKGRKRMEEGKKGTG